MLVAIEGIDGAGKQTQCARLRSRAEQAGFTVATVGFPRYGETFFAGAIEEMLRGGSADVAPRLAGLLFAGDRFESRALLDAARTAADLVVADRYVASNLAYQAARAPRGERAAVMAWLENVEHGVFGLPRPDLTILLDLPVEVAAARIARRELGARPSEDRYESDATLLAACRDCYLELARVQPDWVVVPVLEVTRARTPDEVASDVFAAVASRLAPSAP